MHLKLLFTLFTVLFFSDNASAGGSGSDDGDDDGDNQSDGDGKGGNEGKGDDDVAGLKSALDSERTKAKTAARELKTAQQELNRLKNAGKTDEEKRDADLTEAQRRADAAETRLKTLAGRAAVTDAASKVHAISPKAVFALVKDDLTYDDDGEPTNVAAVIAEARKSDPELFRASGGSGDGGTRGKSVTDANDINAAIRRVAGREP